MAAAWQSCMGKGVGALLQDMSTTQSVVSDSFERCRGWSNGLLHGMKFKQLRVIRGCSVQKITARQEMKPRCGAAQDWVVAPREQVVQREVSACAVDDLVDVDHGPRLASF